MREFIDFLVEARRGTYAIPHGEKQDDDTEQMTWSRSGWAYRDRYAGGNPYGGQELVWRSGKVVWMMNYYAEVVSESASLEEIYAYQREVLGQPDPEHLMRGPAIHRNGDFAYRNSVDGDISEFVGEERITWRDELVYRMRFHGGTVGLMQARRALDSGIRVP